MKQPVDRLIPFDLEASRAAWDGSADLWNDFVESGKDYYRTEFHGPALLDACGPVDGLDVIDLGCGQGYFSRLLAGAGARVLGIDLSENLIGHARRIEKTSKSGAVFRVLEASRVAHQWPEESFDLATACVSFQDMADAAAVAESVFRVLKRRGRFVFSIPHPATVTPYREWERDDSGTKKALKVDRYFDSGPRVLRWEMARLEQHWETPYWSRTIEEWTDILADAGFLIARLREPQPTPEAVLRVPALEDGCRLPSFLIFDAIKPR
jgi:ubiquinone/menaquinone biosynthesis C-methylase UbiE